MTLVKRRRMKGERNLTRDEVNAGSFVINYHGSYDDSDASSFLSSILSEVRRGVEIEGRLYP